MKPRLPGMGKIYFKVKVPLMVEKYPLVIVFSVIALMHVFSMSMFARHIFIYERLCLGTFVKCRTGVSIIHFQM